MTEALKALAHLQFHYTPTGRDVWRPPRAHVDRLHPTLLDTILDGVEVAERSPDVSPVGVVVRGQKGAGKTHLLSRVRELTQLRGGYFFLVSLLDANTFWRSVAMSIVDGLNQEVDNDGTTQLHVFLHRLTDQLDLPVVTRMAVTGRAPVTVERLDAFVTAIGDRNRQVGIRCRDVARALTLLASSDRRQQDVAQAYLLGGDEAEPGERAAWGIRPGQRLPQELVSEVSQLLALTGPSVVAVDQVDGLIATAAKRSLATPADHDPESWHEAVLLDQVASGLIELRELTWRTLTVLSLLPVSWELIKDRAVDTVQDRFRETPILSTVPDPEVGRTLIERRLATHYTEVGFVPPYPTWPVRPEAFDDAVDFTPRELLKTVEQHIRACVLAGEITELTRLTTAEPDITPAPAPAPADQSVMRYLDERYAELRARAQVAGLLDPVNEDSEVPSLLAAGLEAWTREAPDPDFELDTMPARKPALHARLRRTLDDATGEEAHWAFRAIAAQHYNAELARLRNACVAAGLSHGVAGRRLFILRNEEWADSPRRRAAVAEFTAAGGRTLSVSDDDLRSLVALRTLLAEQPEGLSAWLADRRPASRISLLATALADAGREPPAGTAPTAGPAPTTSPTIPRQPAPVQELADERAVPTASDADPAPTDGHATPIPPTPTAPSVAVPRPRPGATNPSPRPPSPAAITPTATAEPTAAATPAESTTATPAGVYLRLGTELSQGVPVHVPLAALRRHVAIVAGSGSGKTVLIRRLVEECALLGVSSIVLDPNNDLARLGDAWPAEPAAWEDGDATAAADYLESTDVVIWTPGREGGRPLAFQPLPDFHSVRDDPDEFTQAVDSAVDALAPRAQVAANTAKAMRGQAVLRQALRYYARHDGSPSLPGLIALLRDLPDGVSDLAGGAAIAADLAENLEAARINDPLFGGAGEPADPGVLLTPAPGKRARVSVISFVGLVGEERRQSFVNQLQLALFSWIKRHPAGDRPLGGLLVMDEAQTLAPSTPITACTRSTLMLASQARKYGLGLIFATQAPKGLHNQIPGNASTQFFGLLNAPAQIDTARELARFKGGDVPDISRLRSGEFYLATEGQPFRKIRTPLCLSHHPASPLSDDEVMSRARRTDTSDEAVRPT